MRNFVIINGVNSNTINGLGINELPPITKPEMRNIREEIDGRDGDIITELGYSAYDKTITIGLFGTGYDINDIVAFFNGEGTIVFSNEDDKYYKYKILNQIDYESLQKFRTASITFHCQPFKYPLNEQEKVIEPQFIEEEGTTLSMDDTALGSLKMDLKGNTSQSGTPTPTSPIPVSVVSGDNDVVVCGKNLLNAIGTSSTTSGITFTNNGDGTFTANGTASTGVNFALTNLATTPITLEANQQYTQTLEIISGTFGGSVVPAFKNSGGTITYNYFNCNGNSRTDSKTPTDKMTAHTYNLYLGNGVSITNCTFRVQLEKGTSTTYEPYQSQTYEVDLPVENILKYPFEQTTKTESGITFTDNGDGSIKVNGTATANVLFFLTDNSYSSDYFRSAVLNKQITISGCPSGGSSTTYRIQLWGAGGNTIYDTGSGATTTFTNSSSSYNLVIGIQSGTTCNNLVFKPMVEYGSKMNEYQPYGTTPIELCKIGTYQDYFTKNSDGQWCKYNAIGKVVLDGSETWLENTPRFALELTGYASGTYQVYSNKFTYANTWQTHTATNNTAILYKDSAWQVARLSFNYNGVANVNEWKNWLSTNNVIAYYPLATPYLSLIEDNNLIEQLDNIQNAMSYEGTTNIGQVNNDKAFIISAKALEQGTNEVVINNIGNAYSKPLIALEGSGNVDIYLDNTQILKANVEDKMNIDIAQLEAYNPDTMTLLNRQVIGNYNSMTLQPGNNTIKMTGDIDKATVSNYIRWL